MNHLFNLIRRLIILGFFLCGALAIFLLYYIEFELPDIEALNTVQLQTPLQIFTKDKKLLATFGEKRRIPVPYDQIPKPLIQAVLATEDQRYFQHSGVDLPGLGRAAIQLVLTGRKSQGGSTITMQVARSFYLTRHKTFARKLREILLAIKIEHKLKKEKILELYLNKVFLGNRAYGVEAAAEVYYGKHLNELSLDQFAMLAGLPKAPSMLNPIANPPAALKRRNHVLTRMYNEGYITAQAYKEATDAPLNASYHNLQTEVRAPYVAELVRSQLEQMYGDSIYTDGFKVYSTIDSHLQHDANIAVRDNLLAYDLRHGYRGPTDNWGSPSIENMEAWETKLHKVPVMNTLEPAVVAETADKSITVLRANGNLITIPWSGLSWARKQVSADYLGARPRTADQIVKLGDLVRIAPTSSGYRLAQIPKAEAGLVALDPQNGAILAMVGGFDYQNSKFNRITSAQRQPGSSFKPFVYSAALEKGYTLATIINDAPIVIENPTDNSLWRPQNDTHKFYGPTRLRVGLMKSRNVVSIRLLAMMGIPYTLNYVQKFGFLKTQLPAGLSLALGTAMVTPLQMAQAYSIFANGGLKVVPFIIDTINNSQGQEIYQAKPLVACLTDCDNNNFAAPRAISTQNSYLVSSTLRDVIQHGTATLAKQLGRGDLAGKTGTTQNQVDAWFIGYNPDIVALAWIGFDQPQSLHEYGAQAALPMWMQFIREALKGKPEHVLEQPAGVVSIRINPVTGDRAASVDSDAIFEFFMLPHVPDESAAPARADLDPREDNLNPNAATDDRLTDDGPPPAAPDATANSAPPDNATPDAPASDPSTDDNSSSDTSDDESQ